MFNETEIQEGLHAKETQKPKSEDDKLRTSASDQVITFLDGTKHVRRLGESVSVPFAGETIALRPGSYHFLGLLKKKIGEATDRMGQIQIAAKLILAELEENKKTDRPNKRRIKKAEAEASQEDSASENEALLKVAEKIGTLYKNMDDIRALTREAKIEAAQFIIYDTKVPAWYEAVGDALPSKDAIEGAVPMSKILRQARREEIDNLLHVYKQLHEAVLPEASFFGLQGVI